MKEIPLKVEIQRVHYLQRDVECIYKRLSAILEKKIKLRDLSL